MKDIKLGKQIFTIHVRLSQNGRDEVVAYITQTNFYSEKGITLPTEWDLYPQPYPVDVTKLKAGLDIEWKETPDKYPDFRKGSLQVHYFFLSKGQLRRRLCDEWVCLSNGENFTNESIGLMADLWPHVIDNYRGYKFSHNTGSIFGIDLSSQTAPLWYPTIALSLDMKKLLPKEVVEWLFVPVEKKQIKNG